MAKRRKEVTRIFVPGLTLMTCVSVLLLMVILTGCAGKRYNQTTDQGIEDSRTAERVREALAAGVDFKYGGVTVVASDGVVQLSGVVNTSAQRKSAEDISINVVGVNRVENHLTVKPGAN